MSLNERIRKLEDAARHATEPPVHRDAKRFGELVDGPYDASVSLAENLERVQLPPGAVPAMPQETEAVSG